MPSATGSLSRSSTIGAGAIGVQLSVAGLYKAPSVSRSGSAGVQSDSIGPQGSVWPLTSRYRPSTQAPRASNRGESGPSAISTQVGSVIGPQGFGEGIAVTGAGSRLGASRKPAVVTATAATAAPIQRAFPRWVLRGAGSASTRRRTACCRSGCQAFARSTESGCIAVRVSSTSGTSSCAVMSVTSLA